MAREYVKKDNMLSKEIRYNKTEKGMMITEYYGMTVMWCCRMR